jgi:nucleoside 2-deoxyribosyltransferase
MKKTVYLAGPLFSEAEQKFNLELAAKIKKAGYEVFLPQENSADTAEGREKIDTADIFSKDVAGLDGADLVVAVLDGPDIDSGTAWEIGYAWARNVPVLGLRTDFRTLGDEGEVNLMIGESVEALLPTTEDLVRALERRE